MKTQDLSPQTGSAFSGIWGVSAAIWGIIALVLIALPLRVISYGYLPDDDALRHAAKAISGKPWTEILVMRPEITIDHNQGWHWILAWVHHMTNWHAETLVLFSVIAMFVICAGSALPWLKRPEAWLLSLALLMVIFPYFAARVLLGRPLLLTMAITITLLCMWSERAEKEASRTTFMVTILLFAVAALVHGAWYLLVLIPAAFLLARAWGKALHLTFCWIIGSCLGALLTGTPWTFLTQSVLTPFLALGMNVPPECLVRELRPFNGGLPAMLVIAAILVARRITGRPLSTLLLDPVFWLALGGWLLGFRVARFWLDWGLPAIALWLAKEIQYLLQMKMPRNSWGGVAVSALAAVILFFVAGSDRNARWSQYGRIDCLDQTRPEHAGWVPEPGGVLYSVDLSVFYETFFRNPAGDWRYVLGFEPSLMRAEDLDVYEELCHTRNAIKACAPWVKRMTLADRFLLLGPPQTKPAFPDLQWKYVANGTWVGRLPRIDKP
ncbi:MAG: Gram-positive signal peptide protein family [Verrucomicrobiales bacterium]|nr:Gram-positive signal peptide protein family [Verrucomicrobiales bacterium]